MKKLLGIFLLACVIPSFLNAATFTVTNTNPGIVPGSLVSAITLADGAPNSIVAFNIPGTGVHTISPTVPLPDLAQVGLTIGRHYTTRL